MQPISTNVSPQSPTETPPSQTPLAASSARLLPWLIAVAFFMESLDTTILNTGVPTIAAALHVAPLSMKSVLASYTLSLAVFIPISGWMADRFGTRRVFASAIGIFTLGSFLCGISSNIHVLVACRILQGCGGAMMVPVGRLTMVRTFAKSELVRAMSFVAIPALVGPMLGPIAGGLIVGYLHWRFIFFVNIPIGLLGLYMVVPALAGLSRRTHQSTRCAGADSFRIRCRAAFLRPGSVWRAYAQWARNSGTSGDFFRASGGVWISCDANRVSFAASFAISDSHISRGRERELLDSTWESAAFRFFFRSCIRWGWGSRRFNPG